MPRSCRICVLAGGGGRTFQNLLDRSRDGTLPAEVVLLIASREGIGAIDRAEQAGVPVQVVSRREDPVACGELVVEMAFAHGVDLVCLAGWMSLIRLPDPWQGKTMNIHPALLPSFGGRGMYGMRVHRAVLAAGCRVSGCTVHFVNNEYDEGPVVLQRICPVVPGDTPESLAARVFEQECIAYPQAIRLFAEDRLRVVGNRVQIRP
jgi:formyltetrahydrofolate-dependent phosphoribosylglycinamide formyltransferase